MCKLHISSMQVSDPPPQQKGWGTLEVAAPNVLVPPHAHKCVGTFHRNLVEDRHWHTFIFINISCAHTQTDRNTLSGHAMLLHKTPINMFYNALHSLLILPVLLNMNGEIHLNEMCWCCTHRLIGVLQEGFGTGRKQKTMEAFSLSLSDTALLFI